MFGWKITVQYRSGEHDSLVQEDQMLVSEDGSPQSLGKALQRMKQTDLTILMIVPVGEHARLAPREDE